MAWPSCTLVFEGRLFCFTCSMKQIRLIETSNVHLYFKTGGSCSGNFINDNKNDQSTDFSVGFGFERLKHKPNLINMLRVECIMHV